MSNTIIVLGRLAKDAERKQTQSGSLLKFSVGDSVGYGDKKSTNWWNCTIFGKQAEGSLIDYLTKGAQIQVTGEISFREYEGKTYNDLKVSRIELVGSRSENQSAPQAPQAQGYAKNNQPATGSGGGASDLDDDLPFTPIHSFLS